MMKRIRVFLLLALISIGLYVTFGKDSLAQLFVTGEKIEGERETASGKTITTSFKSNNDAEAMLILQTGTDQLLFGKNEDKPLAIASITKLMTHYLTLNALNAGNINWEDTYTPSKAVLDLSNKPNFAKLGMYEGHSYTIRELFTASVVLSANDATVALTEAVAGTEENFVRIMNEQAAYFQMEQTIFYNSTGLDGVYLGLTANETNRSSAKDIATLAQKLLSKHPLILDYTSIKTMQTADGLRESTNLMLTGMPFEMEGIDGLKTGYTDEAGACFVSTGIFNGHRVITVVLGVHPLEDDMISPRFQLTKELVQQFAM